MPFIELLPISGAAVSVVDQRGLQVSVAASDDVAARLEELQFDLGEGPQFDCVRSGKPVLVSDVNDALGIPWPMFQRGASSLAVGAIFTLPLRMGAVTVGAVTLHRERPGPLTGQELLEATTLAAAITGVAVERAFHAIYRDEDDETVHHPGIRRDVHQATGMILVQLDISATEAFARLQARAFSMGTSVQAVALDVLEHRLDFSDLPD